MYAHSNLNERRAMHPSEIKNEDINKILRGEISAVEAYEQVCEKIKEAPETYRLKKFGQDHQMAVDFWKKQARIAGKIPDTSSSIWGATVEAFVGLSKIVGEDTALIALKKGEQHGLHNYEDMLSSDKLTNSQKIEIRNVFIPQQKKHIESINALLKMNE